MDGGGFDQLQRGTSEFFCAAVLGKIPGVRRVVFSGYNPSVNTATTPEDIFPAVETPIIPRQTVAESWEILSNSANDTAAGTGAQTVSITTLNGSYAEVTQTVTLNGLTAVPLTSTHIATNSAVVVTAGSSGNNVGLLTIRVAGGGAGRAYISAGDGILNQCKYTVPAGYSLDLYSALMGLTTSGASQNARFVFVSTNPAGRQINAVRIPLLANGSSLYRHEIAGGLVPYNTLPAKYETSIRIGSVSQNGTQVEASVLGLLYDITLFP